MSTWMVKNGSLIATDDLLDDRGLSHGLGVFETLLVLDGRIVAVDLHFERMTEGCGKLGIRPPEKGLFQVVERDLCAGKSGRWRLRVTRTAGPGALNDLGGLEPHTLVTLSECPPVPESIRVAVSPWPLNEWSPLAGIKCSAYAENLVVLDHARRQGAGEALRINVRGQLCEAAMANVFLVVGGRLMTPSLDSGCLPGTARRRVIELARGLAVPVEERAIEERELPGAEAIFLTSATRGVVPVSHLDGRELGSPPELVVRLRDAFEARLDHR